MSGKNQSYFNLIITIFLGGLIFVHQAIAEEKAESKMQAATQKISDTTRIAISTSGPVKFNSYWLDNPYRLLLEFKSGNVIGNADKELAVNQGVIRKITSTYSGSGRNKALKTLTFELSEKVPYEIWQEGNTILLDIRAPLKTSGFSLGARETPLEVESNNVIKRLEAMDTALKQVIENQLTFEKFAPEETPEMPKIISKGQPEAVKDISTEPLEPKQSMIILAWLAGLLPISGLGFWFWREFAQLQSELQEKNSRLKQEEIARQEEEGALQEKNKECEQLRDTYESLKEVLVRKGLARELTSAEEKDRLWVPGETPERRVSPRLTLTKDFHNTVILKSELPGSLKQIKSFAANISSDGICFETKSELDEKNPLNLRLFFYGYGGRVPNFRTQGWIVWKKGLEDSRNYYGVTFEGLSEKVKLELGQYIESNLGSFAR